MADVKWIKIATDIFDNRKIRQIECLPDGDSIIVIWVKLMCLAGCINDSGNIYFTKEIPYTDQMLAAQFGKPLSTVQLALKTFERFGMVDLVDDILHISNWEKYQNVDGMERIREQNRQRKQKQREMKRIESRDSHVTVTHGHATDIDIERDIEEDKEKEIERDKEREKEKDRIDYQSIADLYNSICISFPSIKSLSDSRKKAIKARLNTYDQDDFRKLFEKAEESVFLKGKNDRNWQANFDWLIKDANMAKVIDGNYDNRPERRQSASSGFATKRAAELDQSYKADAAWAEN